MATVHESQPSEWAPFSCELVPERDTVRVIPAGELDLATVEQVRTPILELQNGGFTRVVLDLRQLRFIDSTGLHLILDATTAAAQRGGSFELIAGPPAIQRVFEVAGVLERLTFRSA